MLVSLGVHTLACDSIGQSLESQTSLFAQATISPDDKAYELEAQVHALLEASAKSGRDGDSFNAVQKAKQTGRIERLLFKHREVG